MRRSECWNWDPLRRREGKSYHHHRPSCIEGARRWRLCLYERRTGLPQSAETSRQVEDRRYFVVRVFVGLQPSSEPALRYLTGTIVSLASSTERSTVHSGHRRKDLARSSPYIAERRPGRSHQERCPGRSAEPRRCTYALPTLPFRTIPPPSIRLAFQCASQLFERQHSCRLSSSGRAPAATAPVIGR